LLSLRPHPRCIGANRQCRIVKYTVKNHDNTLAASIPIAENITFSGYNCPQPAPTNTWQRRNGQASTEVRGDFTDQRSMLTTRPLERRFAPPGSSSGEKQIGYDPNRNSTDIETPTGIGNLACAAVLEYRHHDKSNQNGAGWFIWPAF
jgi:hypothetical protein